MSVYASRPPTACALTERPHCGFFVRLEALYEPDAVLLCRGLHSAGIERFVVDADILEMLEVLLRVLDVEIGLLVSLFGGHDGPVCLLRDILQKCNAQLAAPAAKALALMRPSRVSDHWCNIIFLLRIALQGSRGTQNDLSMAA